MKKWIFNKYGDQSVLQLIDSPEPTLNNGEISVNTCVISVNPIDWKLLSGKLRYILPIKFPSTPCFDLSGIVDNANNVPGFAKGDRVFVRLSNKFGGAACSKIAVKASVAAKMPDSLSFEHAAGIPLAALTALQGLRDFAGMDVTSTKTRVLIIGASGGVGHFAVQIAAAASAHVTAVCSTANVEMVKSLGANEVIDYLKQSDFTSTDKQPYDIIFDCVGQTPINFEKRFEPVLSSTGIYVTPAPSLSLMLRKIKFWKPQKLKLFFMKASRKDLEFIASLFTQEKLKVVINEIFDFNKLPDAFLKSMSGRAAGKIIVKVS